MLTPSKNKTAWLAWPVIVLQFITFLGEDTPRHPDFDVLYNKHAPHFWLERFGDTPRALNAHQSKQVSGFRELHTETTKEASTKEPAFLVAACQQPCNLPCWSTRRDLSKDEDLDTAKIKIKKCLQIKTSYITAGSEFRSFTSSRQVFLPTSEFSRSGEGVVWFYFCCYLFLISIGKAIRFCPWASKSSWQFCQAAFAQTLIKDSIILWKLQMKACLTSKVMLQREAILPM